MTDKEIRKWYLRNKRREKSFYETKWKAVADGLSNTPYIPKILLSIYSPDGVV